MVDETYTDEQVQAIYNALVEAKFPYTVYISSVSEEELEVLKECGAASIYYQEDEIDEKLSVVHADDKYYHINYWREELEYAEDVYLWYKEIDGDVYNSDLLDEIFKTAEN